MGTTVSHSNAFCIILSISFIFPQMDKERKEKKPHIERYQKPLPVALNITIKLQIIPGKSL